jgi:type I restriction enzyme S subunit
MRDGLVDQSSKFKKRVASSDVSDYKVIRRGQLVVGFPIDEGVLDFQALYDEAIVSPAYGAWDLSGSADVDRPYLKRFLRSGPAMAYYKGKLRGSTARRRSLPNEIFLALQVPLPGVDEQRRIVGILDQADAFRAKRRRVLAHLDSLTHSVFHDMFKGFAATSSLASFVEEFRYGTSIKSGEAGCPTLRIPNVIGGTLDINEIKTVSVDDAELERLRLRSGDILFVRTNGNPDNVGRCAVFDPGLVAGADYAPDRWIYASYLIRARLNGGIEPGFVAAYLASQAGRRQLRERSKTSAGQYNINIDGIGSVQIPNAPRESQLEFVNRARKVRAQYDLAAGDTLNELFRSIQSRAFRGEL